ncbi:MAG: DUF1269 domain-containing protein [Chloroflexi bacterium]|nr:DUF1269 domain-containing protein [Chloroflexota bacterium]MBK6710049.1 DUF1269 domain-containing protein [Chloroflexota bacterium]MBK7180813.1 DUF1269 domain-containing protein [Chloroflexota bacterium]MBK7919949.1 DUF1269 domain-containing protein [Chloroflexota bacterium]MBP6802896.1 DUF1269 domain-containing protein [Chloroflexota bacterium]
MTEMIVLVLENEESAVQMRDKLLELQKQELIFLEDAAIVVRDMKGKAKIKQLDRLVGRGALGGAFWGLLIGTIFIAPWLGLAAGAVGGALNARLTDVGIDDDFLKDVAQSVAPGQAALFLLVKKVRADKVLPELSSFNAKVLQTSLSKEGEAKLREAFGTDGLEDA